MNQDNNYNFESVTEQPTQLSQQITQTSNINTEYTREPKKGNKAFILIAVLVVIGIVVFLFVNQHKEEATNNEVNNDATTENIDDENDTFLFGIEAVFTISGKGTVVTGKIQRGKIKLGDTVQIIGLDKEVLTTEAIEIEMFRQQVDEAVAGDNVSILLKDITKEQVACGQVLAEPNSIVAAKKFDADVYMLTKEEGGRDTPLFDGTKPEFYFRTTYMTGMIDLANDIETVNPGDYVSITTTLTTNVAMEVGTEFSIREDGQIIAKGTVTKVY